MKALKIIFIALLFLASCKTVEKPLVKPVPVQYRERVVERLVPVALPEDSTSVQALFECDSLNQVILKELSEEKTKRVQSSFNFSSGELSYIAAVKPDTVYLPAKDSLVYQDVIVEVPVPYEVNKLTPWQKKQINAGRLLFALVGIYLVFLAVKFRGSIVKKFISIIGK